MTRRIHIPGVADVDLPWEKIRRQGPEALKCEELLAILFKTGYGTKNVLELAADVLDKHPPDKLLGMTWDELSTIKGIGQAKADILMAAFELARRGLNTGLGITPSISCPQDVIPIIADIKDQKKEHFVAVFLNARNQVIHRETVSVGSLNASLVHPRECFAPAVGSCAVSVILAHNHPSGSVEASREDIELTKRMAEAGRIMGIQLRPLRNPEEVEIF